MYYLLDSRAGTLAIDNMNLSEIDEDWTRYVLLADNSLKEICKACNTGEYGDLCVVSDKQGRVLFELLNDNRHWSYKRKHLIE
jgi:hypothetical protein